MNVCTLTESYLDLKLKIYLLKLHFPLRFEKFQPFKKKKKKTVHGIWTFGQRTDHHLRLCFKLVVQFTTKQHYFITVYVELSRSKTTAADANSLPVTYCMFSFSLFLFLFVAILPISWCIIQDRYRKHKIHLRAINKPLRVE